MLKKKRLKTLILQVLAILGLNLAYVKVISIKFSYMGFTLDIDSKRIFLIIIMQLLLLLLSLFIVNEFFSIVWNIMFLLFFVGESIYYQYNQSANMISVRIIFFFLFLLFLSSFIKIKIKSNISIIKKDRALTFLSFIMFIPFIRYYRYFNLNNLFLEDVYETRKNFQNISSQFTGYLTAPLVRILLPYLVIENLEKRKIIKMLIFVFMILFIYLSGALKSVLFGLLALLIFYKGTYTEKKDNFIKIIILLTFLGTFIALVFDNVFLLDSFIRRIFFTSSKITNFYMAYFTNNYTYLSHSVLGLNLVEYKYPLPLTYFMGNEMGSPGMNASVGLFTEGYISFGYIGAIIFSILICLFFIFLNSINYKIRFFGIVFVYIYYLNTAFLSILLLTHGLFFFIVFSYLFLSEPDKKTSNVEEPIQPKTA